VRRSTPAAGRAIVIGAGIGGLAASVRLAHAGHDVLVLERAAKPGGKLRTVPSAAGPVDAGPTVFTMRPRFEALFGAIGERLEDHLDLIAEPLLARHYWPDGARLDLYHDHGASLDAVHAFAGAKAAREFDDFCAWARALYEAFEGPIMGSDRPSLAAATLAVMARPSLWWRMRPQSLHAALCAQFSDKRLAQLFGRYATYVGGSPFAAPALLGLIWHAEAQGVWRIRGGMIRLAEALAALAEARGATIACGQEVARIDRAPDGFAVSLADGSRHMAERILFNGDPAALQRGLLGPDAAHAVAPDAVAPRTLSAFVWTFAARPQGAELAHHTVFFNDEYRREFDAIRRGAAPDDATLYICAQDRGTGLAPTGPERFEIIMNGAPVSGPAPDAPKTREMFAQCRTQTFAMLEARGLAFDTLPGPQALTSPWDFAKAFPGSGGSLYGLSPNGMMATFRRPTVRSRIPGFYLAGGGVHPGAGVPMALSSGLHAAEAMLTDRTSTSTSRRTVMPGGMSTGSRIAGATASRSSPS